MTAKLIANEEKPTDETPKAEPEMHAEEELLKKEKAAKEASKSLRFSSEDHPEV